MPIPTDPSFIKQWYLHNTGQTGGTPGIDLNVIDVWQDYTGKRIKIGIIDDGIEYTHPDLDQNYNPQIDYDAGQQDDDAAPVYDNSLYHYSDDHGTSVAGIIGAEANNGIGGTGIAYDATLAGLRLDFLEGTPAQDILAFQKASAFDVINSSWSYNYPFYDSFLNPIFQPASLALRMVAQTGRSSLGTVVVFAAGNNRGDDNANYHNYQNSRYSIAVGALTHTGVYSSYSNPGANLLVSAFGGEIEDSIFTTDRTGGLGYSAIDYTSDFGGTSAAAPMVTGVVALMLEANPNLGYRDVQEILAYSARKTDAANPSWQSNGANRWNGGGLHTSPDYGFGRVDAHAAVRLAETWSQQSTAANEKNVQINRSPNLAIPDATGTVVDRVNVQSGLNLDYVEVKLDIAHPWIGNLQVFLISPGGTRSVLIDRPSDPTVYGSARGSLSQRNLKFTLSSTQFWGETGIGNWRLVVRDQATGNVGTLKSWSLNLYGDPISEDDTYIYTDEYLNSGNSSLADNAGNDTINAAAVTQDIVLNLATGGTIAGKALSITGTIENMIGGDGNDSLSGNATKNQLNGGRGDDELNGAAGNDVLTGNSGDDTLTGGAGQDQFSFVANRVFNAALGIDTLVDFVGNIDKIVLSKLTFSRLTSAVGNGFSVGREFAAVTTDAAASTNVALIVYNSSNGRLFYNENGNAAGLGTGSQFAALPAESIAPTDFVIQA